MTRLVTIFGGSGFVGRYVARRLAKDGWRVQVATRNPDECLFVRTYGEVGQVEPVACNIRDDASVAGAVAGADAVVNCVGILAESGKNTFEAVQEEGPERIARLASAAGVRTMVHLSAIGASEDSESTYARSKAEGEKAVLKHIPNAVILRPSIIFGPEDEFFNRFAAQTRLGPVLSIVGADTKFQPVYVNDVAKAAALAVNGQVEPGIYELGGPDVATFRELMEQMLEIIRRKKIVSNIGFGPATFMARTFGVVQKLTFGLVRAPLTVDQVRNLARDNVVSDGSKGFADMGIEPVSMSTILPEYLWRFRPTGQFEALTESARNLRT